MNHHRAPAVRRHACLDPRVRSRLSRGGDVHGRPGSLVGRLPRQAHGRRQFVRPVQGRQRQLHHRRGRPKKSTFAISVKVDSIDSAEPEPRRAPQGPRLLQREAIPDDFLQEHEGREAPRRRLRGHGGVDRARGREAGGDQDRGGSADEGTAWRYVSGFDTEMKIKRSDYGMADAAPGIGDEVTLMMGIEGTRK